MTGWTGLSCLCLLTAYQELVEHFFPSSTTLWHCFWTFFLLFSQFTIKIGKLASSLAAGWQVTSSSIPLTWSQWVMGRMYVAYSSELQVTSCTPCSGATGHFVHTLLISSLTWQQPAAHAPHIPHPNILVCSAWCLRGSVGYVNVR